MVGSGGAARLSFSFQSREALGCQAVQRQPSVHLSEGPRYRRREARCQEERGLAALPWRKQASVSWLGRCPEAARRLEASSPGSGSLGFWLGGSATGERYARGAPLLPQVRSEGVAPLQRWPALPV